MPSPRISVIIPADDPRTPASQVASLAAQTLPPADFEVVIVGGFRKGDVATPMRAALAQAGSRLNARYIDLAAGGRSAAWNLGLRETTAPLVLLLAPDVHAIPSLVDRHLAFHARRPERTVCGLGPMIFPPGFPVTPFMRWLEDSGKLFGVSFTRPDPQVMRRFWYGGNTSLKRTFLLDVGAFDWSFDTKGWEDYELGERLFRAGMQVEYLPDAVGYHEHEVDVEERAESLRESGEAAINYERLHPGSYWWQKSARRPDRLLWALERMTWLRWALTGSEAVRWRYFDRSMERAFARGYRAARAAPGRH